ncbi:hypothetical protein G7054_g12494 [Neopestalotiopsis clavispora]|nr:hypothetical protein G7054_g12494 [Neopestalotiopsis clavispora]
MEGPPNELRVLNNPPYDVFFTDSCPEYESILSVIIRRDDLDALEEYLVLHPHRLKGPGAAYDPQGYWPDAFEYAAIWGATSVLKYLLDYEQKFPGKNLRFRAEEYGLLNLACRHGHLETVRYLLDTSQDVAADVKFRDKDGWTPLLAAADALAKFRGYQKEHPAVGEAEFSSRCEEIMRLLLDRGALPNDVYQRRFVFHEEQYVDLDRRMRWVESHSTEEELAEDPHLGWIPPGEASTRLVASVLSLAIRSARPAMIQRLIDGGSDIHAQLFCPIIGDSKITPLHVAAHNFNDEGIRILYENRGSVRFEDMVKNCDTYDRTPLHEAADGTGTLIARERVVAQAVATFSFLLSHCTADTVNMRDGGGRTALQLLMFFNYNPTDKTVRRKLRTHVARLLVEHGADPSARQPDDGRNAIHVLANSFPVDVGADHDEVQLLRLLAQNGASVQESDSAGNTPLHLAATGCPNPTAVRELLQLGAVPDASNNAGDTPLHAAANMTGVIWGHGLGLEEAIVMQDAVMQLIIEAADQGTGKVIEQRNAVGKTPIEIRDESRVRLEEYVKRGGLPQGVRSQ